ncbi:MULTISPECIES: hypothetical protein [Photorhabdus]|uniref:Uncharacterized protein n=2 Tax=Photorhabdus namnaonensis TaxID=1851568 RepID=A0A1B8YGD2_9GAMM|nr:hypothetical protein [Photorhabdus akhurstii]OCA54122.1 hypothetical protein Phpb_02563 [Photorhabdus namnaonensis]
MASENSRGLKGGAKLRVHLRTFGSKYRWTHNPPSDDESHLTSLYRGQQFPENL